MTKSVRDNNDLLRKVQRTCDELDRKEVENAILQKQKEDAEHIAEITTRANEELVHEIRELNYKTGLYGVTKKDVDLRDEQCCTHDCSNCENKTKCKNYSHKNNGEVNVRFPWIKEHKPMFLLIMGIIIILVLASGFTPTGEFWTAIQDQWLTLIADVFRLVLVTVITILVYVGIIKK